MDETRRDDCLEMLPCAYRRRVLFYTRGSDDCSGNDDAIGTSPRRARWIVQSARCAGVPLQRQWTGVYRREPAPGSLSSTPRRSTSIRAVRGRMAMARALTALCATNVSTCTPLHQSPRRTSSEQEAEDGTEPASFLILDPDGNPIMVDQHVARSQ